MSEADRYRTCFRERLRRSGKRFGAKLRLIRQLYDCGYGREQIVGLFEFVNWVVQLSETGFLGGDKDS